MPDIKVLIADDEPGMRQGAAKVLKRFALELPELGSSVRFVTSEAADGNATVDCLEREPFDMLLLDYKMPGLSGLEVLEKIKSDKIDVVPIMMTAYASLQVAVSATKNGAFDFLAKPFTPEELKSVVEKAVTSLLAHREAKRLADEKRKVRFQFISVLAHELKAPLAAVENYLQLMKKHIAGEDISKYDHIVDRSLIRVDGMRKMIFDLLDLTRIESGQKKRDLTVLNLTEVVNISIENMIIGAKERNISINLKADKEIPLYADRSEMEIICNNLISNAVKYNRDGGKVDITLLPGPDYVEIKVADTGFGMTPEEQERLFGEFVRIKNENTKNVIGSGLGLSILKKLTSLYQGDIKVESAKDVGSTFTVRLNRIRENGNA